MTYDTKVFEKGIIERYNPEELLRKERVLNKEEEQILLKNILYKQEFLIPILYYVINDSNKKHYFLKNGFIVKTLKRFLEDEIELNFVNGINDIKNPKYSQLKSADKRRFNNYKIYTRLINCKNSEELCNLILNSDLL